MTSKSSQYPDPRLRGLFGPPPRRAPRGTSMLRGVPRFPPAHPLNDYACVNDAPGPIIGVALGFDILNMN